MTALKRAPFGGPRQDTVSASTFTHTRHVVDVDLSDLLAQFDVTDEVILSIRTPSGRSKSLRVPPHLLAPTREEPLEY